MTVVLTQEAAAGTLLQEGGFESTFELISYVH